MNPIDIAFLIVMVYGVYKGISQGFIASVITFVRFALAIIIALRFSFIPAHVLQTLFGLPKMYAPLLGFLIMLIVAMALLYLLGEILEFFVKTAHLGSFNKAGGIALWVFILTFLFSSMLLLGEDIIPSGVTATSVVYPYVEPISDIVTCKLGFVTPAIAQIFESLQLLITDLATAALGECQ